MPRSWSWRWPEPRQPRDRRRPRRRPRREPPGMNLLVVAFAIVGGIWGIVSDRIATRWPEHDEPELPGDRPPGWRTFVNGTIGAVAPGALPARLEATNQLVLCGA